jgi:hydroxymethylbilane synthase
LKKLATGEFDAVILAAAGLRRLGLEPQSASELEPEAWLPAPGQGALGVQARADDARVAKLAGRLDDRDARSAVIAERAFLSALGGGCDAPIAALARVTGGVLDLRGAVYSIDGAGTPITGTARGPASSAAALGAELAGRLASGGATRLIRRARAAGSHPPGTRSET